MSAVVDTAQPAKKTTPSAPSAAIESTAQRAHRLAELVAPAGELICDPLGSWSDLIRQFEAVPGLADLAAQSRKCRDDGMALGDYVDRMISAVEAVAVQEARDETRVAERAAELARLTKRAKDRSLQSRRKAKAAAKGFPAVMAAVEAWCALEAENCRLGILHTAAEFGGDEDATQATDDAWQPALDAQAVGALALLNLPVSTVAEAVAKHRAFDATKIIYPAGEDEDELAALKRDLAHLAASPPSVVQGVSANEIAWREATAAFHLATAAKPGADATPEEDDALLDAAADAHAALLMVPAPNLEAALTKLSFIGEYMGDNEFLTPIRAAKLAAPGNDWVDRCVAATYLDLYRFVHAGPGGPTKGTNLVSYSKEAAPAEGVDIELMALGQRFEPLWQKERASADLDGAEYDAIFAELATLADAILAAPARTLAGLRVKARAAVWCQSGEGGPETFALGDPTRAQDTSLAADVVNRVLALAQVPNPSPPDAMACPVAALSDQIEAAITTEAEATADHASAAYQAVVAMEDRAASLQAASMKGAVIQLAFAMHQAELVRGNSDQDVRDQHSETFDALMKSALRVLAQHISPVMWENYVGGAHPGPVPSAPETLPPGTDPWITARDAFFNARAAEVKIDDEIIRLDQEIRTRLLPIPPELLNENGKPLLVRDIEDRPNAAHLLDLRDAWTTLCKAASKRAGIPALNEASQKANNRTYAALWGYVQTPPANLRALSVQLRDIFSYSIVNNGIDTVEAMQAVLDDDEPSTNYLGVLYQHVLRLLGEDSPILACRRDFEPASSEQVQA